MLGIEEAGTGRLEKMEVERRDLACFLIPLKVGTS